MLEARPGLKDVLAGAVFIAFGLAFVLASLTYDVGSPKRMGPGFFPLLLGVVLLALGVVVVVKGFVAGEHDPIGIIDWRAAALVTAALLFFGLTIRGLGVIGALAGTSLLAGLARSQTSVREALVIAVALTALSVGIFIFALQLRLPLVGPWVPF